MLHLTTGTPGTGKSAFNVITANKIENANKVNLEKNRKFYADNLPIMQKFADDFSYYGYEEGTGYDLKQKIEVLPEDYFSMFALAEFENDIRPDDYFLRLTRYNEICQRINEREGNQGFQGLLPVRTIYANIKNLKIDNIRSLIPDWRDAPDGSVFFIDEVQNVEPYNNEKDKHNPIIRDLTIHRHRGFDFYFITQSPELLHPVIRVLIGVHYHMTKPYGWRTRVYQWGSVRVYPNTMVNKLNCERKFDFSPPDSVYKLYKSTTINTHKKRLPWKTVAVLSVFILISLFIMFKNISTAKKSSLVSQDDNIASAAEQTIITAASAPASVPVAQQSFTSLDPQVLEHQRVAMVMVNGTECRAFNPKGVFIEMPQDVCFEYSDGKRYMTQSYLPPNITYHNFKQNYEVQTANLSNVIQPAN